VLARLVESWWLGGFGCETLLLEGNATTCGRLKSHAVDIHFLLTLGADMAKKIANGRGMADPTKLKPTDAGEKLLQVIVETPRGSRNKFSFDVDQKTYSLKKVLPAGMTFPYDFGFLPRTIAEDGDPIDVLLLMDEPAFPGILVPSRLIGVLEGEQLEGKKRIRNDRLLAVADGSHSYQKVRKVKDLPKRWVKELEDFFVNYHALEGKQYKLLGCKGSAKAMSLIRKAEKAA
jgi:inorganic pyrophosphatase